MVKVNKTIRTVFFAALVVLMLFAASCNSNAPNLRFLELDGNGASVESTPRKIYYNLTDKSWYENSAASKKISSIPTLPKRQISITYSHSDTPPVADDGRYSLPEAKPISVGFDGFYIYNGPDHSSTMIVDSTGAIVPGASLKESDTASASWNNDKIVVDLKPYDSHLFRGWRVTGKTDPFDPSLERVTIDINDPELQKAFKDNELNFVAIWGDNTYNTVELDHVFATTSSISSLHKWNFNGKWYANKNDEESKYITHITIPTKSITVSYDVGGKPIKTPESTVVNYTFKGYKYSSTGELFIDSNGDIVNNEYVENKAIAQWETTSKIILPDVERAPGLEFGGWISSIDGRKYAVGDEVDVSENTLFTADWGKVDYYKLNFYDDKNSSPLLLDTALYRKDDGCWYTDDSTESVDGEPTFLTKYPSSIAVPTKQVNIVFNTNLPEGVNGESVIGESLDSKNYSYKFKSFFIVDQAEKDKFKKDIINKSNIIVNSQGVFQHSNKLAGTADKEEFIAYVDWEATGSIALPQIAIDGYKFYGWSLDANERTDIKTGTEFRPTSDDLDNATTDNTLTFYAVWGDNRYYTFTFTTDEKDAVTSNTSPIKRYYKYTQNETDKVVTKAWFDDISDMNNPGATPTPDIAVNLLPRKDWTVTFDVYNSDAGSLSKTSEVASFTLESYTSEARSDGKSITVNVTDAGVTLSDISGHSEYSGITDDGKTKEVTFIAKFKDSVTVTPMPPTQTSSQADKYEFLGWSETPNGEVLDGSKDAGFTYEPKGKNVKLYAVWQRKDIYTLNLNSTYGGEDIETKGTETIYYSVKTGKWYLTLDDATNGTNPATKIIVPQNTWNIVYDVNYHGAVSGDGITSPQDTPLTVLFNGYGSYISADGTIVATSISSAENGIEVNAVYGNMPTVSLNSISGTIPANYTFEGWSATGSKPAIAGVSFTPVRADLEKASAIDYSAHTITLKGVWSSPFFTLTFDQSQEGVTKRTTSALYFDPDANANNGQWYSTVEAGVLKNPVDITAMTFLPEMVRTVRFISNKVGVDNPQDGKSIAPFKGFIDENDSNDEVVTADGQIKENYKLTQDTVITAQWGDFEALVDGLPDIAKDGFTFDGWTFDRESTDISTGDVWAEDPFIPYKNGLELKAVWVDAIPFEATYELIDSGYQLKTIDNTAFRSDVTYAIPSTVKGGNGRKKVTVLSNTMFDNVRNNADAITAIREPNTVLKYSNVEESNYRGAYEEKDSVYSKLSKLRVIKLSGNHTVLPSYIFGDCSSLQTVVFPSGLQKIGTGAFKGCSSLETVSIPDTVDLIYVAAFRECTSLRTFTFPKGVASGSLHEGLFYKCTSLESVVIQEGITTIDANTFAECTSLREINLPSSLSNINNGAFKGCTSIAMITIPSGVIGLGEDTNLQYGGAFEGCTSLQYVNLKDTRLTNIGQNTFKDCTSLTTVEFPASTIKTIKMNAFNGCSSLVSFTIPASVTSIEAGAFNNSALLKDVKFEGSYTDFINIAGVQGAKDLNNTTDETTEEAWCVNTPQFGYVECKDFPYYVKYGRVQFLISENYPDNPIRIFRGTPINETIRVKLTRNLEFASDFNNYVLARVTTDGTTIPNDEANKLKFTLTAAKGKTYGEITVSGEYGSSLNSGEYIFGQLFRDNNVIKGYNITANPTIGVHIGSVTTTANVISMQNLKEVASSSKTYHFDININSASWLTFRSLQLMTISSPELAKLNITARISADGPSENDDGTSTPCSTAHVYLSGTPTIGYDKIDLVKPVFIVTRDMVTVNGDENIKPISSDIYTDNPDTGLQVVVEDGVVIDGTLASFKLTTDSQGYILSEARDMSKTELGYIIPASFGDADKEWLPIKQIGYNTDENAFDSKELQAIKFSPYSYVEELNVNALAYNNISSIVLPESLKKIGEGALHDNPNLESITIGKNLTDFGTELGVGNVAFACPKLETIIVSGENPAYEVENGYLKSKKGTANEGRLILATNATERIGDDITMIAQYAFHSRQLRNYNNDGLVTIDIPETVTSAYAYAFAFSNIQSIKLPKEMSTGSFIGMFWNCKELVELTVPPFASFAQYFVVACSSLKEMKYQGSWDQLSNAVAASTESTGATNSWRSASLAYIDTIPEDSTEPVKSYFLNTVAGSLSGEIYAFSNSTLPSESNSVTITLSNGLEFNLKDTADHALNASRETAVDDGGVFGEAVAYSIALDSLSSPSTAKLKYTGDKKVALLTPQTTNITLYLSGTDSMLAEPFLRGNNITEKITLTGAKYQIDTLTTASNVI